MSVKVAIAGAGVGGLSLAIALRRIGVEARVFEQSPVIGDVGAGIGLWPGALHSLERIGIAEWFWDLPVCPFERAETCAPDGRLLVGFDVTGVTGGWGYVVRRTDLHRALMESLEPDQVTLGREVVGVRQTSQQAFLQFADGAEEAADVVVGADGLHSTVRSELFGDTPPRYSGETCYRGMAELAVPDSGVLREVQGNGARAAVHPLDPEHVYWWATRRAPAGEVESPEQRKANVERTHSGWKFGLPEALQRTPADTILKNDLYDRPPLRRWSVGRIALLGDAAHPTTPNLGLGGCMAIEDAVVLARSMADHPGDHAAALAEFHRGRARRTARVVRMSAMFGRLGSLRNPSAIRLREASLRFAPTALSKRSFSGVVGFDPGPLHT